MRFTAFSPHHRNSLRTHAPDHLARTCSNANASPLTDSTPEAERLSSLRILRLRRTKRLAQTRFNKHDCVATGRARCAIRRRGALWHSGPKNTPLFAPTRGRLCGGRSKISFHNLAGYFCLQFYVVAFQKKKHRNLTAASSLSLLRALWTGDGP